MSVGTKGNKEKFRLLDLSSDDESEDLQLEIISNRKKKITRKDRSRSSHPSPRVVEPNIGAEVQCALCWAVRGTLLLWLLMLTWLCAALYDQVSAMKLDVSKVTTSSSSVSDALQICHTAAKELRANTTDLSARLSRLELEHQELAQRMERAAGDIAAVTDQLSAAPKLADMPRRLADLQVTVANFGSKMQDFDTLLKTTKSQALAASSGVDDIRSILHELETRTNDTIANTTDTVKREEDLKTQMTSLNQTLASRVDALQMKIEQINKQMTTPAPTTPTPATTSTASTTAAVNNQDVKKLPVVTAAPLPIVPPAEKPNVSH